MPPTDLLDAICRAAADDYRRPSAGGRSLPAVAADLHARGWLSDYQRDRILAGAAGELVLGSYVLVEPIGSGGMGTVFQARHRLMRRVVALKLIRPELLRHPLAVERFRREIELAARLSHPNIVLAHDAQEDAGRHFLVMEYCPGPTLRRLVRDRGPLPVGGGCDLARQVAAGLGHAHARGLTHRDVKPDNVLVVGRVAKILDFGLARLLERAEPTGAGPDALSGTPDFLAPEQATDPHRADARADLYGLGCTLYFLLTGQVPFPGGTAAEKVLRHRLAAPAPLPDVPAAVADVVERLMRKDPGERFASAAEVIAALEPFAVPVELPDLPPAPTGDGIDTPSVGGTLAPPSLPEPGRHPALVPAECGPLAPRAETARGASGLLSRRGWVAVVLVGAAVAAGVWWPRREEPPPDPPVAVTRTPPPSAWRQIHVFRHPNQAQGLAFAPDGKWLAVGYGNWDRTGKPTGVRVWDLTTWIERTNLGVGGDVFGVAFSPDGKVLAAAHLGATAADTAGYVTTWDAGTWRPRQTFRAAPSRVTTLAFGPDGRLVAAGYEKRAAVWDVSTVPARPAGGPPEQAGVVAGVAFAPDGRSLATATRGAAVRVWAADGFAAGRDLPGGRLDFTDDARVTFSRDGRRVAAVTSNWPRPTFADLRVWEADAGRVLRASKHGWSFSTVAFTPDGTGVVTGDGEALRYWAAEGDGPPVTIAAARDHYFCAAFSPDGTLLAAGEGGDYTVKVWQLGDP